MIPLIMAKRIYRGFSSSEFNRLRQQLSKNGIEYRQWVLSFGTYSQTADPTEYRLYIHRKNMNKAKALNII